MVGDEESRDGSQVLRRFWDVAEFEVRDAASEIDVVLPVEDRTVGSFRSCTMALAIERGGERLPHHFRARPC